MKAAKLSPEEKPILELKEKVIKLVTDRS